MLCPESMSTANKFGMMYKCLFSLIFYVLHENGNKREQIYLRGQHEHFEADNMLLENISRPGQILRALLIFYQLEEMRIMLDISRSIAVSPRNGTSEFLRVSYR